MKKINKTKLAKKMGIGRWTLYRWLERSPKDLPHWAYDMLKKEGVIK